MCLLLTAFKPVVWLLLLLLLAQVDVLSRQAALAEVLQHRIADQEDVLQQLQNELEHVDAQRVRPGIHVIAAERLTS